MSSMPYAINGDGSKLEMAAAAIFKIGLMAISGRYCIYLHEILYRD